MTDLTPKERSANLRLGIGHLIADEIRAAVEAERERCARVAEGESNIVGPPIAAAIRRGPDNNGNPPTE